jgi:hypothetical protein
MTDEGKPVAGDGQKEHDEPPTTPQGIPQQGDAGTADTSGNGSDDSESRRGQVRFQDPDSATPREPTLAERRARIAAEKRREEQEAAELEAAERRTRLRRRVMVGSGATVGVVALVAAFYSGSAYSEERDAMTATCTATNPQNGEVIAQPDEYCDENYARTHGGVYDHVGGFWVMPMFFGGGGPGQYRYSYTPSGVGSPAPGQAVSTPNFTQPGAGTKVATKSGATIQRGGFGIGGKSGSSGS